MGGGELRMPLGQRLRTWHQNGASSSAPSSLGCSGGSYNEGVRLARIEPRCRPLARDVGSAIGERVVRPRERKSEPRAAVGELPEPPSPGRVAPTV
jgi:hypothetical protein